MRLPKVCTIALGLLSLAGPLAVSPLAQDGAARGRLIPNTTKYSDGGLRPAAGRAGSVTLSARALYARDGTAELEVTTGQFDGQAPATGLISKVQVKSFDREDGLRYARNYDAPSPASTFKTALDGVRPGMALQVQANVRGLDDSRAGVVTLIEAVKLRPDLQASRLDAPSKAVVNTRVLVSATVREANGDVGATARCVLYVDRAEVDSAPGVWVDAGDAVTCTFTPLLTTVGTHQVEVRVADVAPGDYDLSNNAAAGVVEVLPGASLNYTAQLRDGSYRSLEKYEGAWRLPSGGYGQNYDWAVVRDYRARFQEVTVNTWAPGPLTFPVDLSAFEVSDGVTLNPVSFSGVQADGVREEFGYRYRYATRFDPATGGHLYVQSREPLGGPTASDPSIASLFYRRHVNRITYHSLEYTRYWDNLSGQETGYYSWNRDETAEEGAGGYAPFGSRYEVNLSASAVGGQTIYRAIPFAVLESYSYAGRVQPLTCSETPGGGGTFRYCYEFNEYNEGKLGFAEQIVSP